MVAEPALTPPTIQLGELDTVRFTRARVERMLGVIVGLACIVFGVQAGFAAAGRPDAEPWHSGLVCVALGSLAFLIVSGVIGRGARVGAAVFACTYPVVLVVWAALSTPSVTAVLPQPWPWYLLNIATLAAAMAFPYAVGVAWAIATPLLFAAIRIIQGGGAKDFWIGNIADASFALIFGFVLLMLLRMFRLVADVVDEDRERALASYGRATEAQATESERAEMAALMHDSVLSALIAASRADSPRERELSVAMTQEALTGLANAESDIVVGSDAPVSAVRIAEEIEGAVRSLGVSLEIARPAEVTLPGRVARALTLAGIQAAHNAIRHAGAEGLRVTVQADAEGACVSVSDAGPGLDVTKIPDDRLGLRASVFARMAAVGGVAHLTTRSSGTTITLRWQA